MEETISVQITHLPLLLRVERREGERCETGRGSCVQVRGRNRRHTEIVSLSPGSAQRLHAREETCATKAK